MSRSIDPNGFSACGCKCISVDIGSFFWQLPALLVSFAEVLVALSGDGNGNNITLNSNANISASASNQKIDMVRIDNV